MRKNIMKNCMTLALPLVFGFPIIAQADSGYSALPPPEPALNQKFYQMYAPKTQTTFKKFREVTQSVDSIVKQNNDLVFYGGNIMAASAIAAPVASKVPYASTGVAIVGGVGGAMQLVGSFGKASYENFKKGSIVRYVVYFKWTNPDKLEYAILNQSWVEYKGVRVSEIRTSSYSKTF